MRKILTILFLFFVSFGYSQRFPSIDSAKRYTLKYIRNSTVESFTNLRMQNVSYGTLELLEDLVGNGYIDSLWIVDGGSNADTLRYRMGSTTYTAGLISGGGGGTWGSITGTLSSQSDLQAALNAKANTTLTLTINGTAYDLSANRSWTVGDLLSSGSYSNPAWITDLAYSKITGVPSFLQYYLINGATNLGSGSQVFKDTSSNKINLRSIVAGTGISVTQNANDITIASTIPANADSTAARIVRGTFAQRPAVPDTGQIYWQTDRLSGQWNYDGNRWLFNGAANRYIYFTEWAGDRTGGFNTIAPSVSGSGAAAIVTGEQGIDDVMRFSTGTTSSGNTTAYFGQSPIIPTNYDSIIVYSEYKIKIDLLGDASNDFEAFVGVPTSSSSYDYPLFGMLYSYNLNSGNFTTRTRDNNSAGITTKNTGIPVVAGTWYKIGIEIDGFARTIKFYINDVLVTTHSGADNIPFDGNTFTGGWGFIGVLKQAGSIPRFLRNDYVFSYIIKKKYD